MDTILHRLTQWAKEDPQALAQRFKDKGVWKAITARDYCNRVYHLALFLESRGFTAHDVGVIHSINCPQWVHMDLACVLRGMKSAGLYPNATVRDIHYILNQTQTPLLSVQNAEFYKKIVGEKNEHPLPERIRTIVVFDGDTSIHPNAVSYEDALAEGRKIARSAKRRKLSEYLSAVDPHAGLFMIYTSGTTGDQKGALLSLDNFTFTADVASGFWKLPHGRGSLISFLPLCHVAEKVQNIGVGLSRQYTVSFCSRIENVAVELPEVQPTLLLSVPRLWEKMMEGVLDKVAKAHGARKKLAVWALDVGARLAEAKYSRRLASPVDLARYVVADRLVLAKIRKAMGLGHAERLASGAAALPAHVSRWFRCLGLEILEDFGQTESTGVICMTVPGEDCAGTVGKPVPGVEVKLAEDGELLTRGRHVFKGYFKDDASTAAALEGGWLHTGDLAEYTDKGYIRIRGRKKEVMKTSGGKMVAPLPIEERLKAAPPVSQVALVGDGRKYISALITLKETKLEELNRGSIDLAGRVIHDEGVIAEIKKYVDELNRELASYEQIKRFAILPREFSVAEGEMTPTLKIRRAVVENRYRDVIDGLYG